MRWDTCSCNGGVTPPRRARQIRRVVMDDDVFMLILCNDDAYQATVLRPFQKIAFNGHQVILFVTSFGNGEMHGG